MFCTGSYADATTEACTDIDYLMRLWPIFVMTLTLKFQGQMCNLLYLSQKCSDCPETKSKHINLNLGLKCGFDLGHDLDLEVSRSNMEFAISQRKIVRLPQNEKVNIPIYLKASNVTIGFDLGHDLDLEFSRSNMQFPISLPKMARMPPNEKQTYRLNSRPQMWPSDLTLAMIFFLNFQGQIWNLLYFNQKWSDYHEIKSKKNIDWSLECDQWVWPLPWPWHLNFQGQMWSWPFDDQGSGVRIYQIVTWVTSDVGVPPTHLGTYIIHKRCACVWRPLGARIMEISIYFTQDISVVIQGNSI